MSKLNGQLARTEQQAQQATVKKTREGLLNWHQENIQNEKLTGGQFLSFSM